MARFGKETQVTPPLQPEHEPVPVVKTESIQDREPIIILSDNDAYIRQRMAAQLRESGTLDDVVVKTPSVIESKHRLALPRELVPYTSKFGFRWINKNKRAVDHAIDVVGWTLVNRIYFRDAPDHLFNANGAVERGDSILAFMPMAQVEIIRGAPAKLSKEILNHLPMDRWKHGDPDVWYKPKLGEEKDGEVFVGGIQPDA